ncbi:ethanolamine utilization protein EutN [Granulicatella sp. zg-ZJ]|uniref:EutN/CcmL family microcompartment protein n=1 Tax=unclassified Granulicatella TaxID=2630493 RepID=UPI0013BEDE85|nr:MULTISPECIES: EutN/CcmL family microcompartment protein [unclassified Granulicatella]MBS4750689.1 EutN/CcmL family microcompartment protein [Carnobacteriaceae bacterium zg-ZUI78]NEW61862.1 ethanolamine utilization protein EutN [Granulicatella sp. zg-ZJ]NEW65936.1 ethanolamine utilization protein EutN [Granulicatella sp. zg-84]QMI85162.1 EutN/CcmL family microcompartment protein [Carnobacteriaceae bacterium zg-84]
MFVGKVVGSLWATRKDENLNGLKLLVIERQLNEHQVDPALIIAADRIGAGEGDFVLVTTGSSARVSLNNTEVPVDMVVVGIIDKVEYPKDE